MINMDDPAHKRRRNLVDRGFTPRRVADHEPKIREICNQLIDSVIEKGRCDFVREIAAPLPLRPNNFIVGVEEMPVEFPVGEPRGAGERARSA